jgi:hypothetical protein
VADDAQQLQVIAPKGDITGVLTKVTFLLTCVGKPIIINSFHGGRKGLESLYLVLLFADESPKSFLESNEIEI